MGSPTGPISTPPVTPSLVGKAFWYQQPQINGRHRNVVVTDAGSDGLHLVVSISHWSGGPNYSLPYPSDDNTCKVPSGSHRCIHVDSYVYYKDSFELTTQEIQAILADPNNQLMPDFSQTLVDDMRTGAKVSKQMKKGLQRRYRPLL